MKKKEQELYKIKFGYLRILINWIIILGFILWVHIKIMRFIVNLNISNVMYFYFIFLISFYLFMSLIDGSYVLYSDRLQIKFPMRILYRNYAIKLENIESITFNKINTLGVSSQLNIFLKNEKRNYYSFSYRGYDIKMEEMLMKMKELGVEVNIKEMIPTV